MKKILLFILILMLFILSACSNLIKQTNCPNINNTVCGWFDSAKIQCFRYPCALNFKNSCLARQNPNVATLTNGPCPVSPPNTNVS